MTEDSNVDYRSAIRTFMSCHFPHKTLDAEGEEQVAKLLNGLNNELLSKFKDNKKSNADAAAYLRSAQATVENVFEGEMQACAVAEAHRHLALLKTGINKMKGKSEPDAPPAMDAAKKNVAAGIKKILRMSESGLEMAKDGKEFLSTRISNLLEFIATKTGENSEERDVTPLDIKKVLDEYITGKLLIAMNAEGARCLVLYTSGMIKYRPKEKPEVVEMASTKKVIPKGGAKTKKKTASPKKQKGSTSKEKPESSTPQKKTKKRKTPEEKQPKAKGKTKPKQPKVSKKSKKPKAERVGKKGTKPAETSESEGVAPPKRTSKKASPKPKSSQVKRKRTATPTESKTSDTSPAPKKRKVSPTKQKKPKSKGPKRKSPSKKSGTKGGKRKTTPSKAKKGKAGSPKDTESTAETQPKGAKKKTAPTKGPKRKTTPTKGPKRKTTPTKAKKGKASPPKGTESTAKIQPKGKESETKGPKRKTTPTKDKRKTTSTKAKKGKAGSPKGTASPTKTQPKGVSKEPGTKGPKRKKAPSRTKTGTDSPSQKKRKPNAPQTKSAAKPQPKKKPSGTKRKKPKETKKSKSPKRKAPKKSGKRKFAPDQEGEEPTKKQKTDLDFTRGINTTCKFIPKVNVSIKRDAGKKISTILADICHKLVTKGVELAGSQGELTAEHIEKATEALFPLELARHAINRARNNPLCSH